MVTEVYKLNLSKTTHILLRKIQCQEIVIIVIIVIINV